MLLQCSWAGGTAVRAGTGADETGSGAGAFWPALCILLHLLTLTRLPSRPSACLPARPQVPSPDGSGALDDHGVHAFICPLRDDSGNLWPGVEIHDCGWKVGLAVVSAPAPLPATCTCACRTAAGSLLCLW